MSYKAHLFICTASPDKPGKCGSKGSMDLRTKLKTACAQKSFADQVRINTSGCLDQCEHGIAAVLYPEGKWFLNQTSDSFEFLMEQVEQSAKKGTDK